MTLAERLRRYLTPRVAPADAVDPRAKLYVIMTIAGHKPSGLADIGGGYRCACDQAAWVHLTEFGPYGGCPAGWYDAREFLTRYGVRDGAE